MVKKKISGQTIAIIILATLLLISIVFGGVYAFYSARSNQVYGHIVMANLKISLNAGEGDESGQSEFFISNTSNVVPGQTLNNTALTIENLSSVYIYLAVVYEIDAHEIVFDKNGKPIENAVGEQVVDEFQNSVLGIGVQYINPLFPNKSSKGEPRITEWVDYVYRVRDDDENATDVVLNKETNEKCKAYRCLVSTVSFPPKSQENDGKITVIEDGALTLSLAMDNEFQSTSISFILQAYAIGAATIPGISGSEDLEVRCKSIMDTIYASQDTSFLKDKGT